jgi:hypothetical protein
MDVKQSLAKKISSTATIATVIGILVLFFVFFRVLHKTAPLHQATAEVDIAARYALFLEMKDRMFFPEETYTSNKIDFSKSINGACSEISILPTTVTTAEEAMTACAEAGDNINNFQQPCFGVVPKTYGAKTFWFACLKTTANRNEGTWLRANLAQGLRPKSLNSDDYATYVKSLTKEEMMELCSVTPDCVGIRVDAKLGFLKCQETQVTYNKNNDYWILESEANKGNVGRLIS